MNISRLRERIADLEREGTSTAGPIEIRSRPLRELMAVAKTSLSRYGPLPAGPLPSIEEVLSSARETVRRLKAASAQ